MKPKYKRIFDTHLSVMPIAVWLFLLTVLFSGAGMVSAQDIVESFDDPLLRIRIESENIDMAVEEFNSRGYDVLYQTKTETSIELIVTHQEFVELEEAGYTILEETAGRPFEDIAIERGEDIRGTNGYPNLDAVLDKMRAAAKAYPDIAKFVDITQKYGTPATVEGRHLYAVKISDNVNQEEDEPATLVVSTHHAREIVTPVIALHAIDQLTKNYATNNEIKNLVNNHEIWIAPIWNPDGYNHVFVRDNNWRKNRHVFSSGIGVDQNRNYPHGWYASCSGSTNPSSNAFKGKSPASEAESKTMIQWSLDQHFSKVVDFHSSGREVVYGYQCSKFPSTAWKKWMANDAGALSKASGYNATGKRPPSADGEHFQWQFGKMGAWSFLVETALQFQPAYSSAQAEAKKVWPGIKYAINRPLNVSGHVTDARTGNAIKATIEIPSVAFKNKESNSSESLFGRYHMFVPKGTYTIRFSAKGYISKTEKITIATNKTAKILDIQLEPENVVGPSAPKNLTATPGTNFITLDWRDNPESNVSQYNVKRATAATGPFNTIRTVQRSQYTDNSVTTGITYYYVVTARDSQNNESSFSNKVSATPGENPPTPSSLASDGFEAYGWKGGKGWIGAWKKTGDVKKIKKNPFKGKKYVRIRTGNGKLERTVDLSIATNPVLKFATRIRSFEGTDKAVVKVSRDGKNYSEVMVFTSAESNNIYKVYEIPLMGANKSKQFKIVFEAQMDGKKDYWYLDDIEIINAN